MLMCVLLTACDSVIPSSGNDSDDTRQPHIDNSVNMEGDPLVVYCYGYTEQTNALVEKYNKHCAVYGDYNDRVEVVRFTDFAQFNNTITTELMSGKGPDLFFIDSPLPFEKMCNNGSLADIDKLIEESGADINLEDFNKVIMDAGVFDGKRYILPVFYCVDTLFSTQDRVDSLGIDPDTVTLKELADIKKTGKDFTFAENVDNYVKKRHLHNIIYQFTDFENNETYFHTDEFSEILDSLDVLYEENKSDGEDFHFQNTHFLTKSTYSYGYYGASAQDVALRFIMQQEAGKDLILFPSYNRDKKVSAYVEAGIAVNANTQKTDKVIELIKFLLSDNTQAYHCGALRKERLYSYSTCSLPVKNSILQKAFQVELEDVYGSDVYAESVDPEALKLQPVINEKKNKFLSEKFIPLVESIEECTIFNCRETSQNYYILNIVTELTDGYMQGTITKEKFISQLENATKTYMTE